MEKRVQIASVNSLISDLRTAVDLLTLLTWAQTPNRKATSNTTSPTVVIHSTLASSNSQPPVATESSRSFPFR